MEDDYFDISPAESQLLDELQISYRWRDSCLAHFKEAKMCARDHPYLERFYCIEPNEKWRKCQFERERKICSQVNLQPAMKPPPHLG